MYNSALLLIKLCIILHYDTLHSVWHQMYYKSY